MENHENLLSTDRRMRIVEIVNQRRSISVEDLAKLFPVSTITIRRDLDRLAEEKLLRRVHGGAMALSNIVTAPRASELFANITEAQRRIGREASLRITDGDFIIIESGSTCIALVEHLYDKKRLKVVTVSPRIVMMLAEMSEEYGNDFELISSGGLLNINKNFFFGPHARTLFENIKVDIAFVSVTAISSEAGITADSAYEAEISKTILEKCARLRIGLIYASKFEKTSFVKVAAANIFDEIITDSSVDQGIVEVYRDLGIKMTVV
jgi:DeoR/GlpR family transcriptional regulator of sugar metabolism